MASTQKGPLSWCSRSAFPPTACPWASRSRPGPGPRPSSPFPELADRAVCTALGAFQAVLTGRPLLSAQFQQTQTDHHNPLTLDVGLAPQPLAMGSVDCLWPGQQMWAFQERQLHEREEKAARGAGLGAKEVAAAGSERGSLPAGRDEVVMSGNWLECRSALCDSHGRGPKATSRQMGNLPFCMNTKHSLKLAHLSVLSGRAGGLRK